MARRPNLPPSDRDPSVTVSGARLGVRGVALVLHGGSEHSMGAARPFHPGPLRMRPFAARLAADGGAHGLAVWNLLNRVRGWNGAHRSALQDARWALERIGAEFPGAPVYLLGHSMGGRTALAAADHPQVRAVAALAPWIDPADRVGAVRGRNVLIQHGDADRTTSPASSLAFARHAQGVAGEVRYVRMLGVGHFMLRDLAGWHGLSTGYLLRHFAADTGAAVDAAVRARAEVLDRAPDPLGIVR